MASAKKKTKKQSPELTSNPSLPYDLVLTCFARVSRLYYPTTLSLVSKSCRSLIASPELYKTRSLLNHKESCLYVCLEFSSDPNQRWFTLCRKPNQTLTNKSSVSHTRHEAPRMRMKRSHPAVNVVDGKIYVAGGLEMEDSKSSNWMEVFDPKTQSWELVCSPLDMRCCSIHKSFVIEGKIYLFGGKDMAYKPKEDKWIAITEENLYYILGRSWLSYRVIDNVIYCWNRQDGIMWYDSEVRYWIKLKGLEGLPTFAGYSSVRLVDHGGKLVVLWDKYVPASRYKVKVIWCAVISLEKRNSEKVLGKVEWFDVVLTVPKSQFLCAISATV
ncbi:F-box/kelch-repeat protein At5g49000 isoform X2 [Capsella rubella]|uniref:F-box/kelch-repeat protein At5g49000 isoform X2 n=1 Tax=Capsella rubella TaxID=81985 RepID=UPI000CD5B8F7|nr:F-box/kelch-repeat protein At5g49000 isoform X2 [Capsella rubella]